MTLLKHKLAGTFGLLLLAPSAMVQALEPGAMNPPRPDYQLPELPKFQPGPEQERMQLQTPEGKQAVTAQTEGPKFMLRRVQFEGNDGLTDEQLQAVVLPFIDKAISRVDLENIRQQLMQHYRKAGYLYPSVLLPSQHISQGLVRYQINEGHLTAINVKGAERLSEDYIRDRIQLDKDEPLQQSVLLERFQLLLTDPLIERVNGALKPGAQPGETILDLDITRAKPYALYLGMDNYTPPSVGAYTGRLSGLVRNMSGLGDFLQLDLIGSEGMQGISGFFSLPFTRYDTRFNIGVQASQAKVVDQYLEQLNIRNDFIDINVGVNQPLFRSLNRIFNVELQYAFRQTKTSVLDIPMPLSAGVETNGRATVNVFRFIQNYMDRNAERVWSLRSSLNFGFEGFDATINSEPEPDSRYFSWQGQLRYLRRLDERGTELFFRTDMQFASESLLPLERFALGGVRTVRGYRENELVRDEGYAMSLELRYPLWMQGVKNGHQLRVIPFFDFGEAWNKNENGKTLYSAGIGFKWQWQKLGADFYWAQSLNSPDAVTQEHDAQDSGFHFQIHAQLL